MITNFKIFEKVSDYNINRIVNGNYETILDFLLKNNADVNKKDDYTNRTPLINAARNYNLSMVKKLLNAKAEVNSIDRFGYTALLSAVGNIQWELGLNLDDPGVKIDENIIKLSFDIIIELIKHNADWTITLDDKCILDYLNDKYRNILFEMFPDKFNDYIIAKDAEIYNL
jgi:hypothetical protein